MSTGMKLRGAVEGLCPPGAISATSLLPELPNATTLEGKTPEELRRLLLCAMEEVELARKLANAQTQLHEARVRHLEEALRATKRERDESQDQLRQVEDRYRVVEEKLRQRDEWDQRGTSLGRLPPGAPGVVQLNTQAQTPPQLESASGIAGIPEHTRLTLEEASRQLEKAQQRQLEKAQQQELKLKQQILEQQLQIHLSGEQTPMQMHSPLPNDQLSLASETLVGVQLEHVQLQIERQLQLEQQQAAALQMEQQQLEMQLVEFTQQHMQQDQQAVKQQQLQLENSLLGEGGQLHLGDMQLSEAHQRQLAEQMGQGQLPGTQSLHQQLQQLQEQQFQEQQQQQQHQQQEQLQLQEAANLQQQLHHQQEQLQQQQHLQQQQLQHHHEQQQLQLRQQQQEQLDQLHLVAVEDPPLVLGQIPTPPLLESHTTSLSQPPPDELRKDLSQSSARSPSQETATSPPLGPRSMVNRSLSSSLNLSNTQNPITPLTRPPSMPSLHTSVPNPSQWPSNANTSPQLPVPLTPQLAPSLPPSPPGPAATNLPPVPILNSLPAAAHNGSQSIPLAPVPTAVAPLLLPPATNTMSSQGTLTPVVIPPAPVPSSVLASGGVSSSSVLTNGGFGASPGVGSGTFVPGSGVLSNGYSTPAPQGLVQASSVLQAAAGAGGGSRRQSHLPEPPEADIQCLLQQLPPQGKLMEAVLAAGPLLQTLLSQTPAPRRPPPPGTQLNQMDMSRPPGSVPGGAGAAGLSGGNTVLLPYVQPRLPGPSAATLAATLGYIPSSRSSSPGLAGAVVNGQVPVSLNGHGMIGQNGLMGVAEFLAARASNNNGFNR